MSTRAVIEQVLRKHFPSRETLSNILNDFRISPMREQSGSLYDRLMAWAQGKTRREWCPHFRPVFNPAHPNDDYDFLPHTSVVTLRWTACPICRAPRPPEIP